MTDPLASRTSIRPSAAARTCFCLRPERHTNAQLAQPLADGVRGEAEGAGDREQQSERSEEAEGDCSHLGHKECQSKLVAPGTRFPDGNGSRGEGRASIGTMNSDAKGGKP
jgi:hypothetical protein